jgi:hypothetical protein
MKRTARLVQLYLVLIAIAGTILLVLHWGNQLLQPIGPATRATLIIAAHAAHGR